MTLWEMLTGPNLLGATIRTVAIVGLAISAVCLVWTYLTREK